MNNLGAALLQKQKQSQGVNNSTINITEIQQKINNERQQLLDIINNLKAENESLKAENESLKAENEYLKAENEYLKAENTSLKAENESLKAENTSLKAENESLKAGTIKKNPEIKFVFI